MRTSLSTDFIAKFPSYLRFTIIARNIDNFGVHEDLQRLLNEAGEKVRNDPTWYKLRCWLQVQEWWGNDIPSLALDQLITDPRIKSWREAFRSFNVDPDDTMPSVQSLVYRAQRASVSEGVNLFAYHNTVVALSNYISLKYLVPCGADDLGLIHGDYGLRLANGGELFVAMDSSRVDPPEPGEVVLADRRKVLCRRWIWKQGVHTMVSRDSRDIAVNVDILPPVTRQEGEAIAAEVAELLRSFCGGETTVFVLDQDHPVAEFETPPFTFENTVYDTLELRGYIEQSSDRWEVKRLLNDGTTIYQGFDPTAPSLHVAHLMSLMVFRYLQTAGNRLIFILGGGTAQVGDPSGRDIGRPLITVEQVEQNKGAIKRQVQKMGLIDFEADLEKKPHALMLDNSEWLDMPLLEYAREVTRYFSVNDLVKRDTFRKRIDDKENLSLLEFLYTTLQGFDFLYLYEKYGCCIQMGGNDQWANILDGMDLIRRRQGGKAYAMTFPLLMDRTGQKMGKTAAGEKIWLEAEGPCSTSPFDFYQYWVGCSDEDLGRNLRLFTFLPLDEIDEILAGHPRAAQHRLAFEVTKIVHGEKVAEQVQRDASRAFGHEEGLPENVLTYVVNSADVQAGFSVRQVLVGYVLSLEMASAVELDKGMVADRLREQFLMHGRVLPPSSRLEVVKAKHQWAIVDTDRMYNIRRENQVLNVYQADSKFLPSASEVRRRIDQGGVRLNGTKLSDVDYVFHLEDFVEQEGEKAALVRYGKSRILKVVLQ